MKDTKQEKRLPFAPKLKKLVDKIFNPKYIYSIYLIGSFARHEMTSDSDLNLLIICKIEHARKVQQKLVQLPEFHQLDLEILEQYSGGLSPLIFSKKELYSAPSFTKMALNEGNLLAGKKIDEYVDFEKINVKEKKDPTEFLNILDSVNLEF